jgi:hypothetical protein
MNWSDVTLWQYQQIENLLAKRGDDTELDLAVKSLAILTNRTETQIDSLSISELKEQLKTIEFLNTTKPEPKTQDYIKIGKKKYRCIYDIRKMPYARYVEAKYFASDITNNLHKIAASMIMPMKLTWRGWKLAKYDASKHDEYAQDLLSAPFEQVYGSVVFFCQVFADSIINLKDYFKEQMIASGTNPIEAEMIIRDLCASMDGFTKLRSSLILKKSDWKKYINYLPLMR